MNRHDLDPPQFQTLWRTVPPPPSPPRLLQAAASQPPPSPFDPSSFRDLARIFASSFEKYESNTTARFEQLERVIDGLCKATSKTSESVQTLRQETKDALQQSRQEAKDFFGSLGTAVNDLAAFEREKVTKLENVIGNPDEAAGEASRGSVFGLIGELERSIIELGERTSVPDAARLPVVKNKMAVNTSPLVRPSAVGGVDALDLLPPIELVDSAVQADIPQVAEVAFRMRRDEPYRTSTGSQTTFSFSSELPLPREMPFDFSKYPMLPMGPASWSPNDDDTGDYVLQSSCIPGTENGPVLASSTSLSDDHPAVPCAMPPHHHIPGPLSVPTLPQTASSVIDEQEIVDSLREEKDSSQYVLSSPGTSFLQRPLFFRESSPLSSDAVRLAPSPSNLDESVPMVVPTPSQSLVQHAHPTPHSSPLHQQTGIFAPSGTSPRRAPTSLSFSPTVPSSSTSESSLSSLTDSLPPSSPRRPLPSPRSELTPIDRSPSLSSLSSLSSLGSPTAPNVASSSQQIQVPKPLHVSAPVKVKAERVESASTARPAKRRKTTGTISAPWYEAEDLRGVFGTSVKNSASSRARGKGKGTGVKRKSQKLIIEPIKDPAPAAQASQEAGKHGHQPPQIGTDCSWPKKLSLDQGSPRKFVQCDYCEAWYHFGCVGLMPGDPRLESDAEFICPPCNVSPEICEQRQTVRFQNAACARPDCDHPGGAEDTQEYFVERIIGRRPYRGEIDLDVEPTDFMWLVKWDGFKADQATWGAKGDFDDCSRMIEEFEFAAQIEGRKLADHNKTILLNEAAAAGWAAFRF